MNEQKSNRIFYFDALRALAIFSVILVHVFDGATSKYIIASYALVPSLNWFIGDFFINCSRIGVDLFLMLSGALSLGRDWTIKSFLSKRLPRIILPFLFWGFVLSGIMILLSYYLGFGYICSFDLMSILNYIYSAYMANTTGFWSYWFFWMILGTYFAMPIFNKWVKHASLDELEYFLLFWLITCLFNYTLKMDFPISLTYFTSPIGLVVLGYYLRHTRRKILNNPYFDIFLIIVSWIAIVYLSYLYSDATQLYKFSRYSLPISIEVIGVFLLFKNFYKLNINWDFLSNPNNGGHGLIEDIARCSYGIYLTHSVMLQVVIGFLPNFLLSYGALVFIFSLLTLFIPLAILLLLNKVPYLNAVIGVK